jgi:hypothetical protein
MSQAVALLSGSPFRAHDAGGRELELVPSAHQGTRLTVSAERLAIGAAESLATRVHGDDLRPWMVTFEVESAAYQSAERATVVLRARSIRLDERHRHADRTSLGGHARLTAINCQNVVDGDVVEGSIVDVSDNGVAFHTRRLLRAGDRLTFSGRFFATVVEAEVRVARVSETAGQLQVGCTFLSIEPSERAKLRAVTTARPAGEAASFTVLQQITAERVARERDQSAPRWRRVFRRSA